MRFVLYVEVMLSAFDVYMCVVKSDVWRWTQFTCDTIWSNSIEAGLQITFNCVASLIVFRFQRSHNNRRNHWEGNNGKAQLTIGWRRGIRYICLAIEYADRLWCEHQTTCSQSLCCDWIMSSDYLSDTVCAKQSDFCDGVYSSTYCIWVVCICTCVGSQIKQIQLSTR